MRKFFIAMSRDPLSLFGMALTTAAALVIFSLFAIELVGFRHGPYVGILAYLILPTLFILGLLLIPLGVVRGRRRARAARVAGRAKSAFPVIDLNRPRTRSFFLLFVVFTFMNIVILATATYKGVEVMESTEFCGSACHSVMHPELTAYERSPHARVKCVSCHIGPGAGWFAKSKLSGAWQLISVNLDLYSRPISTPLHDLRPARETCEQCHWPTKFVGDRLMVRKHYDEDEANTELTTALLMRVGGRQSLKSVGIHWHVDPEVQIRYRSDPSRETIYAVELTDAEGTVTTYNHPDPPAAETADEGQDGWRLMDCVDCHNRPTHVYRMPEQEIDTAIEEGRIDRSLPFVRREGLRLLAQDYSSHEEAGRLIGSGLREFYTTEYPQLLQTHEPSIRQAADELSARFALNVFPEMNIGWGTYPSHLGHEVSSGCFRCHNDEHVAASGAVISQDCSTCHELLAMGEENPEILSDLGL